MTFDKTIEYLNELSFRGSVLGLANMQSLNDALCHPADDIPVVHIAGTNGKGSVTEYIKNILIENGYKVGTYTSPVVFDYLEKIRYGNRNISKADFSECIEIIKNVSEERNINITVFEAETMAAFLYFKKKECDIIVLETGLGGQTDATNIVSNTKLAVFTSISIDHTDILGKTIEEIASVKAGIIKPRSTVVTAKAKDSIIEIFRNKASTVIESKEDEAEGYKIAMSASYQQKNASVAINAAYGLRDIGYSISDKSIKHAIENTVLPGRFEIISKSPLVVIDGAHNIAAAIELRKTLLERYPDKQKIFIMGVFADKDYEGIIKNTVDLASQVVTLATPDSTRSLPSMELANAVKNYNPNVSTADSVEEAYEIAKLLCKKNMMIVAFGSLSYLGRLKGIVTKK